MPKGTCIPTLLNGKNLAITGNDHQTQTVEINGVSVSHPGILTAGPYSIHGVLRPFLDDSLCGTTPNSSTYNSRSVVPWTRIIRVLSSSRFLSFAIGLYSVLEDYGDLNSVTIFVPPDLAHVALASPLLDRIVRYHMLPERFSYGELASLPKKALLRMLVSDRDVEVTGKEILAINGVEITVPDVLGSREFVIHGILGPLPMIKLSSTSS